MTRILVVDDHPIARTGISGIIDSQPGMEVVGEAGSSDEALAFLEHIECEVIVTDLAMPGSFEPDGIAFVQKVALLHPQVRIVVLTSTSSSSVLKAILSAGASSMLDKGSSPAEIIMGITMSLAKREYVSKRIRTHLLEMGDESRGKSKVPSLSPRQADVVRMLFAGASNNEVSERLGISPKTVSRQKRTAMQKLGVRSDGELFSAAQRLRLIE